MKKIFTLSATILLTVVTGFSQISTGINAGLNNSRWSGNAVGGLTDMLELTDGIVSTQAVNGFYVGGYAEVPIDATFSFQPGIYYSQKGFSMRGTVPGKELQFLNAGARARVQSHYIDIPLLLKAEVANGLQIYAGPQVSYLAKSNLRTDAGLLGLSLFRTNTDVTGMFNKVDFAVTGGLGYTFQNGLTINAGYDHGLTPLDKNSMTKSFNRTFKIGLGFRF